jgi:signal transduction histidine kinase
MDREQRESAEVQRSVPSDGVRSAALLNQNNLLKRENRNLHAYQELRILLSGDLSEPLAPLPPALQGEKVRMLLVDDERSIREGTSNFLAEIGFDIAVASSVEQGFLRALEHRPEVALIDFYMPDGNGDELIRMLREDERTASILPLLFTVVGREQDAIRAGAVYWMHKQQGIRRVIEKMERVRHYMLSSRVDSGHQLLSPHSARPVAQPLAAENRRVLLVGESVESRAAATALSSGSDAQHRLAGKRRASLPFQLSVCQQGAEAERALFLAQRQQTPFAVALVDLGAFPAAADGLAMVAHIRQLSPGTELILLAAEGEYELAQIRQRIGLNFTLIAKPCNLDVLIQRVVADCEQWRSNERNRTDRQDLLGLAQDMEQEILLRQQTEAALEQASQAKDEFLATMSHELRTPLTSIIGNSEMLAEMVPAGDRQLQKIVHAVEMAGRAQLALVNDILDMSKIQSGNFAIDEAPYSLPQLLHDMEHMFSSRAEDAGLHFSVRQQNPEPLLLLGDGQRIGQILINLLGNAIKFTELGAVSLITRVEGGRLLFRVQDSGIGIAEEALERLFHRFQQADASISRRFGGTGLGLSISKRLAQLMGGILSSPAERGSAPPLSCRSPTARVSFR